MTPSLEQRIERGDDADADDVVVQRNVPEPSLSIGGLEHHRRAFVAPGVAIGAFPVGPDGALVEHRVPDPEAHLVLEQAVLSAGVDDHLGAHLTIGATLRTDRDADRAVVLEQDLDDANAFVHVDAVLARVVQHHLVELAAHHLPRLGALVRLVVPEVERRRELPVGVRELHAVLLDEAARLHLRQHVEPLEHPVRLGNERLADVKPRKALAFEQLHAHALLRQQRRHGRSGGSTADDHYWRCIGSPRAEAGRTG